MKKMKCKYCNKVHEKENTGCENSGHYNSGDRNSGHYNSGHYNSGHYNSGDRNSGHYNSGHRNSGHYNSGHYNSGDRNSGIFNTNEPKMRSFNKECDLTYTQFREKFGYQDIYLPVCSWINKEDMSDDEKKEIKGWSEMGGYLKTLDYKEAWKLAWSKATQTKKDWYKSLPNFDTNIFEEITGIRIDEVSLKGKKVKVELDGKSYEAIIQ